jgi:hypothetical protein
MTREPKYAPAREDGLKPWHVTVAEWGREWEQIVYAKTSGEAEYVAKNRSLCRYPKARRATPADLLAVSLR